MEEATDNETDDRPPMPDPRWSGLRTDDPDPESPDEELDKEESKREPPPGTGNKDPLETEEVQLGEIDEVGAEDPKDVAVSPVSSSDTEEGAEEEPSPPITKEEVLAAARRLEESLRIHEGNPREIRDEVKDDLALLEPDDYGITLPSHYSDGDVVPGEVRDLFDELNRYDAFRKDDSVMA